MASTTKTPGSRQQAGYACEECRRKKSRCDRARPTCNHCAEAGTLCVVVGKRSQKGAKRGSLDQRRPRTDEPIKHAKPDEMDMSFFDIERTFAVPPLTEIDLELQHPMQPMFDTTPDIYSPQVSGWPVAEAGAFDQGFESTTTVSSETGISSAWASAQGTPPLVESHVKLSDLMWADLDQLYFDRVHPICPMVHQWRYMAWTGLGSVSPAQNCLRAAMRTMAAAMSVQYRGFSDALYSEAKRLLEESCQKPLDSPWPLPHDSIPIEKIQAWLLLAHYQILCMDERTAMLTAGRAMRLVQIARLYELDANGDTPNTLGEIESDESLTQHEERRRTFWVAYTLDRFLCLKNEWPLTLQEEIVNTKLPVPEYNYQNSQPSQACTLSQAMAESTPVLLEPFAHCIVMATIHGRCLTHRKTSAKESNKDPRAFWNRQKPLSSIVEKMMLQLRQSRTTTATERDPMLVFAHCLAYSAVIHLSCTAQKMSFQTVEYQLMADGAEQRALRAVSEMIRLAKAIPSMWCLKSHPFLPNPLASATTLLIERPSLNESGEDGLKHIVRLLKDLSDINALALGPLAAVMTSTNNCGE